MSSRLPPYGNDLAKKYKKKRYYVYGKQEVIGYSRKLYSDRTNSRKLFHLPLDSKKDVWYINKLWGNYLCQLKHFQHLQKELL